MPQINLDSEAYKLGYEFATTLKVGDSLLGGFLAKAKDNYKDGHDQMNFIYGAFGYFDSVGYLPCVDDQWIINKFEDRKIESRTD